MWNMFKYPGKCIRFLVHRGRARFFKRTRFLQSWVVVVVVVFLKKLLRISTYRKKNHEQHAPLGKAQVSVSIRARKQKDCDSDTSMDLSNREFP